MENDEHKSDVNLAKIQKLLKLPLARWRTVPKLKEIKSYSEHQTM